MRVIIHEDQHSVSQYVAEYLKVRMNEFQPSADRPFVIGIPANHAPLYVFQKIAAYCKRGEISFTNVILFVLDEYIDLPKEHVASHSSFMWNNFFRHLDIAIHNIHYLDGNATDLDQECRRMEQKIQSAGGIEFLIAGASDDGHIAFNEPGSSLVGRTRVKTLAYETIMQNTKLFGNDINKTPKLALTVGVGTIMEAREVIVTFSGICKAVALKGCIEKGVNNLYTVSMIQMHPKALIVCDDDATAEMRVKTVKYFKNIQRIYRDLVDNMDVPTTTDDDGLYLIN